MIIGLCGEKGSGKDTVAAYLIKEHGFERRAFADPMKKSVAALLDIPYHEIDNFKNDDTVFVTTGYKNFNVKQVAGHGPNAPYEADAMWSPIRELTFREFLQRFGTESHRDVFGEDFWLDQTLPVGGYYSGRAIVVTDVRFENEVRRIQDLGGHVVRVMRPGLVSQDPHRSEAPSLLSVNYRLINDGTIEELSGHIEHMLDIMLPDRVG